MAHIIVIEDEADFRMVLEYNLEQAGYAVVGVGCGAEGLRLIEEQKPDLVLLDLMLPDISGTQICRMIKGNSYTSDIPVMMVTARGEEIDRVVGFEMGADDYVVKPFSMRELLLRVSAVLRRHHPEPVLPRSDSIVEFGLLRMDRAAYRVWVNGEEVAFTALEFRLLMTLYESRGRVQTRGGLLSRVWGVDEGSASRTVDTHVKRLRDNLKDARDYVETVRGVGYRFVGSPEEARS